MDGNNCRAQNFNPSINEGVQTDFNNNPVKVNDELNKVLTRDYSALMNAMDK
jgi:hypothetical protein